MSQLTKSIRDRLCDLGLHEIEVYDHRDEIPMVTPGRVLLCLPDTEDGPLGDLLFSAAPLLGELNKLDPQRFRDEDDPAAIDWQALHEFLSSTDTWPC